MRSGSHLCLTTSVLSLISVVLLPGVAAMAGPGGADDAASGADAPDLPPSGLVLREGVVHDAAFHGPDDEWDWFVVRAEKGAVVHVEVHARSACVYVAPSAGPVKMACATAGRSASLWFRATEGTIDVGVEGGLVEPYKIAYRVGGFAPRPAAQVGVDDDAGSGRDAPGIATPLVLVRPDVTYRGSAGQAIGDLYDWYAVDVAPGTAVRVSGTPGAAACFDIVAPDQVYDDAPCDLRPQEPVVVTDAHVGEGIWYLRVGAAAGAYGFTITTRG